MVEIKLYTNYVDKDFSELTNLFKDVFDKRNLEEEFVNNPFGMYWILYLDNNIIGFLNINKLYENIEIVNINILEKYKGVGYSKLLMNELINYSKKEKISNITLEVNINNFIAINLYKKYKFLEKAIRKGYYNGTDGILMERQMM